MSLFYKSIAKSNKKALTRPLFILLSHVPLFYRDSKRTFAIIKDIYRDTKVSMRTVANFQFKVDLISLHGHREGINRDRLE